MAIVGVGSSFKILSIEYEWKRELKLKRTIVYTRLSRYTKQVCLTLGWSSVVFALCLLIEKKSNDL